MVNFVRWKRWIGPLGLVALVVFDIWLFISERHILSRDYKTTELFARNNTVSFTDFESRLSPDSNETLDGTTRKNVINTSLPSNKVSSGGILFQMIRGLSIGTGHINSTKKITLRKNDTKHLFIDALDKEVTNVLEEVSSQAIFPKNISGVFRMKWFLKDMEVPSYYDSSDSNDVQKSKEYLADRRQAMQFLLGNDKGKWSLQIKSENTSNEDINYITGISRFENDKIHIESGLMEMKGIHLRKKGQIFLITGSHDKLDIDDLLLLIPYDQLIEDIDNILQKKKPIPDAVNTQGMENNSYTFSDDMRYRLSVWKKPGFSMCTICVIGQLKSLSNSVASEVSSLVEAEEDFPIWSNMTLQGFAYSQDCGIAMGIEGIGMTVDMFQQKALNYIAMIIVVCAIELFLTARQMEYTDTAALSSKVSLFMIGQQAIMDAYSCLLHLTAGIVVAPLFKAFAIAAFLKFIVFSVFEMRYMLLIWKSRRSPGVGENEDSIRRELGLLYSRFYGYLIAGLIVFYESRGRSLYWFVTILYSFWIPQLIHSVLKDIHKPLLNSYIIGMTLCRLTIPLYFYGCSNNILGTDNSFGPSFFLPQELKPKKYDYHPKKSVEEFSGHDAEACNFDCVICMLPVDMHGSNEAYMVTPCNHLFHSGCLQEWMAIKLECPTCRSFLPEQ